MKKNDRIRATLDLLPEIRRIEIEIDQFALKAQTEHEYRQDVKNYERLVRKHERDGNEVTADYWRRAENRVKKSTIERKVAFRFFREEFRSIYPELAMIRLNWRAEYFQKNKNVITVHAHKRYGRLPECLHTKAAEERHYRMFGGGA